MWALSVDLFYLHDVSRYECYVFLHYDLNVMCIKQENRLVASHRMHIPHIFAAHI